MMDIGELKHFASIAQSEIDRDAAEDELRHLLSVSLGGIFPDHPWWIRQHVVGTETYLHFADSMGNARVGFADVVVGKTAIEYERNLRIDHIFNEGYRQVGEYCAALCNMDINPQEIRGVLSDTVRWHGYGIRIMNGLERDGLLGGNDIELFEEDFVDLSLATDEEFGKFELFVNKYFDREQSRLLTAKSLVLDFGLDSDFYAKAIQKCRSMVKNAMESNPGYAELVEEVWQNFVAYLGASEYGEFSFDTYVNEYYLVTVAKLIAANILCGSPRISDDDEIAEILDGSFFRMNNIQNLVDYDYFGWLNKEPHVPKMVDMAKSVQTILKTYDYSLVFEEDLFGELLAQLSSREHRLLLGQDFTPHWVAGSMVDDIMNDLDDKPRILDMCCGSGVFLIESVKKIREKYLISPDNYDEAKDEIIFSGVMGFDIDPLAIMLAKVNWIMSMRDLFPLHQGQIVISIYHADSLFAATPITHEMPGDSNDSYIMHFGKNAGEVEIPGFMLTSENRPVFDAFMSICYNFAMERAGREKQDLTERQIDDIIVAIDRQSNMSVDGPQRKNQRMAAYGMISQLEELQRRGRNGIWYFIINNSYKPSLVAGQFNRIVSNPPWLAMSKLADNPYKIVLQQKTADFGIKPPGSSHLHMELATTFLLASVDRYLMDGARWMCVMPGSILNGYNHEPFRIEKFKYAKTPVDLNVDTIWELPMSTFKNKAVVLGGKKSGRSIAYPVLGREYDDSGDFRECNYELVRQGDRTAWAKAHNESEFMDAITMNRLSFKQGADIMPRTEFFHKFTQNPNGLWSIDRIEKSSDLYYLWSDSHKDVCKNLSAEGFEDRFMYDCLVSKHLSPFFVSEPAKVIIPGIRVCGKWRGLDSGDFALMNVGTKSVFKAMEKEGELSLKNHLEAKMNIRSKMDLQDFSNKRWLVLSGASGSEPCAAVLDLDNADRERLIVDQTLYWMLAETYDEAVYIVGLLNSGAMSLAISDFQPQGGFGKRHIHTLPYKIIPQFDADNDAHVALVSRTLELKLEWDAFCDEDSVGKYLEPDSGSLPMRRRKLRQALEHLPSHPSYEDCCKEILGLE